VAVHRLLDVVAVHADQQRTTAVLADGTARAWGRDGGDGRVLWPACATPQTRHPVARRGPVWISGPAELFCPTPAPVHDLADVAEVVSAGLHACALLRGGQVWCWGSDAYGSLGDAGAGDRELPVRVDLRLSATPSPR
jgi:alpha-tubulin suppressor-like RCC1 family protein